MNKDSDRDNRSLMFRPFFSMPFFDDEFWGSENNSPSGLSVSEDDQHVYIEAHVPGMTLDDIELSLDKHVLHIKGHKKEEEEDKKRKFFRKATSSYSYSVNIPSHVDVNADPEATYKDGVIKITFQKNQNSQARKISIKKT